MCAISKSVFITSALESIESSESLLLISNPSDFGDCSERSSAARQASLLAILHGVFLVSADAALEI